MLRMINLLGYLLLLTLVVGINLGLTRNKMLSLGEDGGYSEIVDSPILNSLDTQVTIECWIRANEYKGQLIRTISLGNKNAGIYTTKDRAAYWDGRGSLGQKVSSGLYYYTLQAGEFRATRKMVIVK